MEREKDVVVNLFIYLSHIRSVFIVYLDQFIIKYDKVTDEMKILGHFLIKHSRVRLTLDLK